MSPTAVPDRVQIVPLGFEYARLREPVDRLKADVVVAVEHAGSEREIPYIRRFLDELDADERVRLRRRECDIFDLYDTLGTVAAAVEAHADDEVFVNLSAGSKITAIAGMIACMTTGARPIYARPDYGPDAERIPDEPLHEDVAEVFELPSYPVDRPSETHLRIMAHVESEADEDARGRYRGRSKKELIEFARDREFRFVAESEATTEKGYYRLLDTHVVRPLVETGYVEVEQVGRRKFVSLTAEGRNTLRAFERLLD